MRAVLVFAFLFLIEIVSAELVFPCEEGSTFHHEGSCSVFYACYEADKPVLVYCSGHEEYNHQEGRCDPPEEANCVLPDKSAWEGGWRRHGSEEKEDAEVGSHKEEELSGWSEENVGEGKEESVDSKEDNSREEISHQSEEKDSREPWFSWFHVVGSEVMRDGEGEKEKSDSNEEQKPEDFESHEDRSAAYDSVEEEHSLFKRRLSFKRLKRSEGKPPKLLQGSKVVDLEQMMKSGAEKKKQADENLKSEHYKRSVKTSEEETEEKKKEEESVNSKKSGSEEIKSDGEIVETKESEETKEDQQSKELVDGDVQTETKEIEEPKVEQDSKESVDVGVQTGEVKSEHVEGCEGLIVSDPLEFQLSTSRFFQPQIHIELDKDFPFNLEAVLGAAYDSPKKQEEKEEAANEKGEEKIEESQESAVEKEETIKEDNEKEKSSQKEEDNEDVKEDKKEEKEEDMIKSEEGSKAEDKKQEETKAEKEA